MTLLELFASHFRRWLLYGVSPLVNRFFRGRVICVAGFSCRLGECDLYTLANVFTDYDVAFLRRWLEQVELVVDAGANVGAFSWLVRRLDRQVAIVALEPEPASREFLLRQSFAGTMTVHAYALAHCHGVACLQPGMNSVTAALGDPVQGGVEVVTVRLDEVVTAPCLVKMDIEGAEKQILSQPLPGDVRAMFLEWHDDRAKLEVETPGRLTEIGLPDHAGSCWIWERM